MSKKLTDTEAIDVIKHVLDSIAEADLTHAERYILRVVKEVRPVKAPSSTKKGGR